MIPSLVKLAESINAKNEKFDRWYEKGKFQLVIYYGKRSDIVVNDEIKRALVDATPKPGPDDTIFTIEIKGINNLETRKQVMRQLKQDFEVILFSDEGFGDAFVPVPHQSAQNVCPYDIDSYTTMWWTTDNVAREMLETRLYNPKIPFQLETFMRSVLRRRIYKDTDYYMYVWDTMPSETDWYVVQRVHPVQDASNKWIFIRQNRYKNEPPGDNRERNY